MKMPWATLLDPRQRVVVLLIEAEYLSGRRLPTSSPLPLYIYKTGGVWLVRAEDTGTPGRAARHMRRGPSMRNLA